MHRFVDLDPLLLAPLCRWCRSGSTNGTAVRHRLPQRHAATGLWLACCSAMSFMGGLLAGSAPLRGRASLELVVHTFDYRLAAKFWGISDPRTAVLTNAIVGGTPAYRREFSQDDVPAGPEDFDSWVAIWSACTG